MPNEDVIRLSVSLPSSWWHRLQRVSATCWVSPWEFIREVLEAEIVRRETLLDEGGRDGERAATLAPTETIPHLH